jgi:hypothetical protein
MQVSLQGRPPATCAEPEVTDREPAATSVDRIGPATRPRPGLVLGAARSVERFLSEPASPRPLGALRIGVCMLALVQLALLWPYAQQLYGNFGLVQWAIIELGNDVWLPTIGKLALLAENVGIGSTTVVHIIFAVYGASLVGLLLGWKARLFGVAAWILHSLMVNSGYLSLYGVDTMLHICLFYAAWMPMGGAYSIQHFLRRETADPPSFAAGLSIRALQFHLCIIYVNTSLAKMSGSQWWNGEAIWRALMEPQFAVFDMSWLAGAPWVATIVCWGVLLVEGGYPFLIWPRRTRLAWVVATVLLHLGIAVSMGLWLFGLIMALLTLSAFGVEPIRALWLERRARPGHRVAGLVSRTCPDRPRRSEHRRSSSRSTGY